VQDLKLSFAQEAVRLQVFGEVLDVERPLGFQDVAEAAIYADVDG
jgi:hypothetical protein